MLDRLTGKVAVVTGASRGIGRAIALRLAQEGAAVVINYNGSKERAQEVKTEIESAGGTAQIMQCDVADAASCDEMFQTIIKEFGRIDILVNNAGITRDGLLMKMAEEDFDAVIDTNLKGTFHCIRAVSRQMLRQRSGRIINLSSVSGVLGNAGQANYSASKAGVIGLTKSAARELASRGITVNAIAPGFINTEMTEVLSEKVKEGATAQILLESLERQKILRMRRHFLLLMKHVISQARRCISMAEWRCKNRRSRKMKRRVVVTGMGAVTPIGNTVEEFWNGIKTGKVGIGPITKFDTTDYKVKLAAEVKDFVGKERMDFKAAKRMELFSQYAVAAAKEAFADAGLDMEQEDPYRVGTIIGSGIGSLSCVEQNYDKIQTKGPARVNPLMVPLMISNMAAGNVSIQLGLKGKCTDVVTACASGSNSIGDALRAIQYGDLDVCVAGGTESCICPTGIAGFTALTALSTNEDPMTASRPFDQDRDGFVLGEGAGIVVLEELEHAKARGAKIYAELAGYGSTGDAYHITSPAENGEGAGMAMKLAMKEAGVAPEEVDYINAHGTSTHHNDLFETRAICYALGDAAENVVVNSTKSMIGHLLGAAGAVEFVVCVKSILDNFIHQTVGTKNVDPECGLNYAVGAPVEKEVNCVISNSLGFGGHNVSLLVKRFEE